MARDLSPYSARLLLTQQLRGEKSGSPGRARAPQGEPERARREPLVESSRRARSRSREPRPREKARETRPRHVSKDGKPRDAPAEAGVAIRTRDPSPEPYRKPREPSRERRRDRSRDKKRERSRDRRRDDSRDKRRHRSRSDDRDEKKSRKRDHSDDRRYRRDRSRSRDRRRRDRSKDGRRSKSPLPHRERKPRARSPSASTSPPPKRRRRTRSPSPHQRAKKPLASQEVSFRGLDDSAQPPSKYGGAPPNKEKPNFKASGVLAKHANRVEGTKISLKYHEPPEARKPPPSQPWRIFVFKGEDVVDTIEIWQKSCWLLGRSHEVVDYVLEHPSSSGQHAVIQFRYIQKTVEDEFGVKSKKGKVKPYILDLDSSNGTELNGVKIEGSRYFELRDKDILQFAGSEREYVVMLPPPEDT